MTVQWDYSSLAATYDKRAEYPDEGVDFILRLAGTKPGSRVADLGAGTAKLTKKLLSRGLVVDAVEPNDEMRKFGEKNTAGGKVTWRKGTGEETGLESKKYELVTFGSSFNVTQRELALKETRRLLLPRGWFACMWNHRDLDEALQKSVEDTIKQMVPGYGYGTRRESQTEVLESSGLFSTIAEARVSFTSRTSKDDYIAAWRSHATLQRQAGERFGAVVDAISALIRTDTIDVPYRMALWVAQMRE